MLVHVKDNAPSSNCTISAAAFTAEISLAATDRIQTILITAQGGDIPRVSIVLSSAM
jgi:hypothetical protein